MQVYHRSSRFIWLLPVGVALAVAGFLVWYNLPTITDFQPNNSQHPSEWSVVEWHFSQPMISQSVETRVQFEPAVPGRWEWFDDNRAVRFIPAQAWRSDQPVTVSLEAFAQAWWGGPLFPRHAWQFQVATAQVIYIGTSSSQLQPEDLWQVDFAAHTRPQRLTNEPTGVQGFAVHPSGLYLTYLSHNTWYNLDLNTQTVTVMVPCDLSDCLLPAYSPSGEWLAYEGTEDDRRTIRMLNISSLQSRPLPSPDSLQTPRWLDKQRLSFYNAARQQIGWFDLQTAAITYLPDLTLEMGSWSRDGSVIIYARALSFVFETPVPTPTSATALPPPTPATYPTFAPDDALNTQLVRADVTLQTNRPLFSNLAYYVEDAAPSVSPSGDWVAFARRTLVSDTWTLGRQLWLSNSDGSNARQLTNEPNYNYTNFVWTADESSLVFVRFNIAAFNAPAEIWKIDLDSGVLTQLSAAGFWPVWLP
jgi:hypothetical protein